MTKENEITLESLFVNKKLIIPSYQRAYAWEEKQLEQFVSDMLEIKGKGRYYFGHFILEEPEDGYCEIIDGQQRITTFILFLMVCRLFKNDNDFAKYIDRFETVSYDQEAFKLIQYELSGSDDNWLISSFNFPQDKHTLSIQRILLALNYFRKLFKEKNSKIKLDPNEVDDYVSIFTTAHISKHTTNKKDVAVQIFELQNTRGIKLNLIEKVKSKLMKAVYINSNLNERDKVINEIQKEFAEIYRLEELVISSSFRGEISLEDIFFHHLRIIDDGSKLSPKNRETFNSPSKHGNKEELILNYINKHINEKPKSDVIKYIYELANKFRKSVELASNLLPQFDNKNPLIGDVLILDKSLSLEFFFLLFHLNRNEFFNDKELIQLWEKLLFTRDFHDKYYRLVYRDNFEELFYQVAKRLDETKSILDYFVRKGFRPESMEEGSLPKTVSNYIQNNNKYILTNAFHWLNEKMVYTLYKYDLRQGANVSMLRNIMKEGRSVEHILPQSWEWHWIGENDLNNISEEGKKFIDKISSIINGIGNLLLITGSENSSEKNNHPCDKYYNSCIGGSYSEHNDNPGIWRDHNKWEEIIVKRGEKIYEFLKEFVTPHQSLINENLSKNDTGKQVSVE